ncbi:MAG: hypothetical protein AB7T59_12630 [Hyphomonadaceae bacterium]
MSGSNLLDDDGPGSGFTAPRHSAGESDFCSRDGAQALKARIEAYWRARGHTVTVGLHNVGFHPAIRAARFDVRSDMINGMPRTAAPLKPGAPATAHVFVEEFDGSSDDLVFE